MVKHFSFIPEIKDVVFCIKSGVFSKRSCFRIVQQFFSLSIKLIECIRKQINEHLNKKAILENQRLINVSPEARADSIIKTLRDFPSEPVLGDYDFRSLFKQMIVVNRDRLIFVIGSNDMSKIPHNPNAIPMSFIDSYEHKVRATATTCYFGIFINK